MLTGLQELNRFLDRSTRLFEEAVLNILRAKFMLKAGEKSAVFGLARLIKHTLIMADLHGRKRTLMEADAYERNGKFSELPDKTPINPGVEFEEALNDILTREPRLARSAAAVARLYTDEHAFAMARSASMNLTKRVQKAMMGLMQKGGTTSLTENEILRMAAEEGHDWTRAYAATVYRTNAATAYSRGRFQQAMDEEVKQVIPAMELVGIDDDRTRPNHRAGQGLIAATVDPVWERVRPPLGYNCRDGVIFVSKYDLERKNLLRKDGSVIRYEPPQFHNCHPDEGFRPGVW